jgi:hypothetical protein
MDLFKTILLGYVRHGLTAAAGYLLAHGLIEQADQQVLISAVLALAGIAWSTASKFIQNRELTLARKALPPGVKPPCPLGPVTKA